MITIEVNGNDYRGFTSASALRTLDTMSGEFEFIMTRDEALRIPFKSGDECIVRVDGVRINTGFIERIGPSYDEKTDDISSSGRDLTQDVIDSSLDVTRNYQSNVSFVNLINSVLSDAGIPNIDVFNSVSNLRDLKQGDISASEVGETIFSFLESIARKLQVFLITDGLGNIIISRNNGQIINGLITSDPNNTQSNILGGNFNKDLSNRFNKYIVKSQSNLGGLSDLGSFVSSSDASNVNGEATDTEIRTSRKLTIVADKSYTTEQCQQRAEHEANIRRIESITYTVTLQGHQRTTANPGIWLPNQLVKVVDVFSDVDSILLINTVRYIVDNDGGNKTQLTLVDVDAYQVQASKPVAAKKSSSLGSLF